jgi:hypothetical protein
VVPPEVFEIRHQQAGEFMRIGGDTEEAAETERDLVQRI